MNTRLLILASFLIPSVLFSQKIQESWAHQTLQHMSVREKIGQLFMVTIAKKEFLALLGGMRFPSIEPAYIESLIKDYHVGGILYLGRNDIPNQMLLSNKYQALSRHPLLVLEDFEWGLDMRLDGAVRFPRNIALGAIQNESLIFELGTEIGRQCKAIGVHVNLAPVVDINNNPLNPIIGTRSFGENPQRVAHLGTLFMKGLQDAGVIACAKHFPGHGDTDIDSHFSLPVINHDKKRLHEIELVPFKAVIDEHVDAIMPGHLKIPALDPHAVSTISYPIITQLLKEELAFKGLVITDALCMGALNDIAIGELELQAFVAGNDIFICSLDIPQAIDYLESALHDGKITEKQLDERVLKMLQAKERVGLHQEKLVNTTAPVTTINTSAAYVLKKQLYQEIMTVVHNQNNALPLDTKHSFAVLQIGDAAYYDREPSLESAFANAWGHAGVESVLHIPQNLDDYTKHLLVHALEQTQTVVIGLFGIASTTHYKDYGISESTRDLLELLRLDGKQIILAVFGNPYCLNLFGEEDAILVAYEDDPDAQEAAVSVIVGALPAHGKLPITASPQFYAGLGLDLKLS